MIFADKVCVLRSFILVLLFAVFHLVVRILDIELQPNYQRYMLPAPPFNMDGIVILTCSYENDFLATKYDMNIHEKCHNIKHTSVQGHHCLTQSACFAYRYFQEMATRRTQDHLYLRFAI